MSMRRHRNPVSGKGVESHLGHGWAVWKLAAVGLAGGGEGRAPVVKVKEVAIICQFGVLLGDLCHSPSLVDTPKTLIGCVYLPFTWGFYGEQEI
jgi:hypothetical protein